MDGIRCNAMRLVIDPGVKNLAILAYENRTIVRADLFSFGQTYDSKELIVRKLVSLLDREYGHIQVERVIVERQMHTAPRNITLQACICTFFLTKGADVRVVPPIHKFDTLKNDGFFFSDEVIQHVIHDEEQKRIRNWKKVSIQITSRILARDEERWGVLRNAITLHHKKDDLSDVFLMFLTAPA